MNSRAINTEQQIQGTYNADHPETSGQAWMVKGQKVAENLQTQVKGGLASAQASLVSAKEQVFGAPIKPIEGGMPGRYHPHPETVEATVPGSTLMDKVKSGLASAQTTAQAGLTSAQAGLLSAKDSIFGTQVEPIEEGMPGRNHPHPETYEVSAPTLMDRVKTGAQQGLISTQAGIMSAKNAVFGEKVESIESGMPGRYHPHPETFEAPAPTLLDRVKTGAQQGLASTQPLLIQAQAGLLSAKNAVFGEKVEPIESGMPGRYHPHPESLEAPAPTLLDRVKTGAQQGLVSTQAGLLSAKNAVFGEKIESIESGMPGRNHPHPETFEAPAPSLLDRVKTGAQQGLASTQPLLIQAQAGLLQAKNAVFGETIEPIEAGMPGRNHPHPETFEAPAPSLMDKMKGGLVTAQTTVQSGLISAQSGLFEAKKRVWGTKVEQIEGGMPGRNHPHPERFYAPTPSLIEKVKSTLVAAPKIAGTQLFEAKKRVWGTKVEPIEGGMPGRNHPHPERFYAPTPSIMEKVKSTLVSAEKLAETGLLEAKKRVWGAKIDQIEGGMPGRNHPHAERFYAPAPTLMDKMKGGLIWAETSVQAGLVSAKDKVLSLTETIEPVEGGMPGRNHPQAETFEAPAPGLMDKMKGGLASTQLGLISAKERIFGKPTETHPEIQAESEIEKESIDQDAVRDQLEESLAKETIHPLQGMPGPGRNHPMADSHKAQDQGLLNKLSDKLKNVFIGEKDVTGGSL